MTNMKGTVLAVGAELNSFQVTGLLGRGGMGEVYRAKDSKLKREVAIKILPEEFSRDPERVSRFQREAEVLASLNHPNIGAIHDLQEFRGGRFLVLELVDGETLAQHIGRGGLSRRMASGWLTWNLLGTIKYGPYRWKIRAAS